MTEAEGIVERVEGDYAWVRVAPAAGGCGSCDRQKECRGSLLGSAGMIEKDGVLLRVTNGVEARPGEAVVLGVPEGTVLRAALLAYMLPLLLALSFAMMASMLLGGDAAAFAGAMFGLALGFHALRRMRQKACAATPVLRKRGHHSMAGIGEVDR